MPESLARIRAELAEVDAQLQRSIVRRLALARSIGRAKRARGLPIRDPSVERRVLERWRVGLEEEGVPADRAETLARWLVDEAVRAQEVAQPPSRRKARAYRVSVVGGAGAMGRWLVPFLRARGHEVAVIDPRRTPREWDDVRHDRTLGDSVATADVVVVATPMAAAPQVYRQLLSVNPHGVVVDILSVKRPIVPWIARLRRRGIHVASAHPMFGPVPGPLAGRPVLLVDCGDSVANRRAAELFQPSPLSVIEIPLLAHDALMADLQVLPRLTGLLFAMTLDRSGRTARELDRIAPPSFRRQLEASRYVVSENPHLAFALLRENPSTRKTYARVQSALRDLSQILRPGGQGRHRRLLDRGRRALGTDGGASRRRK